MTVNKVQYDKSLSADIVIFTINEDALKILLVQRAHAPDKGKWALPGGFRKIGVDHNLDDIANRRLIEETGTKVPYLEQLYTFGSEDRDPRGWVTTVAYFAFVPYDKVRLIAGEGVSESKWRTIYNHQAPENLAFDHSKIIGLALERVRSKLEYTPIAPYMLGDEFTLPQMQKVYELILDCDLDKTFFRRSLKRADILIATKKQEQATGHKRAMLYKFKKGADKALFFPRGLVRSKT